MLGIFSAVPIPPIQEVLESILSPCTGAKKRFGVRVVSSLRGKEFRV